MSFILKRRSSIAAVLALALLISAGLLWSIRSRVGHLPDSAVAKSIGNVRMTSEKGSAAREILLQQDDPTDLPATLENLILVLRRERAANLVDSAGNPLGASEAREEIDRLLGRLSSSQLQQMMESILSAEELDDKDLQGVACLKILARLAGEEPAATLALLEKTGLKLAPGVSDLFVEGQVAGVRPPGTMNLDGSLILLGLKSPDDFSSILSGVAGANPRIAVDWLQLHPVALGCRADDIVSGMVAVISNRKGLATGLEMAKDLQKTFGTLPAISMAATTKKQGERLDLIAALHGSGPQMDGVFEAEVLTGLGQVAVQQDGYDEARTWLDSAPLSVEEKKAFLKGMNGQISLTSGTQSFLLPR